MNHALNADYHHTRERLGINPSGCDAASARAHARQAGRQAAIAGFARGDASGHIARFIALSAAYAEGFAEAEHALFSGADAKFLSACLIARTHLDKAIQERDERGIDEAVQSIFSIAADYPGSSVPFFSDTPEIKALADAAFTWRREMKALEEAAASHAEWQAALPSGIELKTQVEMAANGEGKSFDFEGYTLWHEPAHGGWSLTNVYGVDNCAFLASVGHFEWLINAVKTGREIGPVPPGCESPDDEDDHPDYDATYARLDAAMAVCHRLGIAA